MGRELPCLLVDAMLGRLAKWLRLMGYDVLYASGFSDHQIAAHARAEQRVVLTRDHELIRRKGIRCLLIHSDSLEDQLGEVVTALGEPLADAEPRCPRCNALLVEATPDEARPHVPSYVLRTQRRFGYCPDCDKYYWAGSHWQHVRSIVERVQAQGGTSEAQASPAANGPASSAQMQGVELDRDDTRPGCTDRSIHRSEGNATPRGQPR